MIPSVRTQEKFLEINYESAEININQLKEQTTCQALLTPECTQMMEMCVGS